MTTKNQKEARIRNWFIFWAKGVIKTIEKLGSDTYFFKEYIHNDEKYFLLSLIKEFKKFIFMIKENNNYDKNNKG